MLNLLSILLMSSGTYSILGVIHLIIFIGALVQIVTSSMSLGSKLFWVLVVLLLPIIGLILYYLIGRKA